MDIFDHLHQIASRIPELLIHIKTEEATKNALVLPLLNGLGYNVFDPTEVIPEFIADVGTKKGEKVDYVIMRDGKPIILIECKTVGAPLHINHASQLFRYFSVTDARFAILTNGIDYQVYTDIEAPNKMDSKPFLEFSMLALDQQALNQIRKFSKSSFDLNNILSSASELKYKKLIQGIISTELESPTEDFVRHFTRQVYSGVITASVKTQFTALVGEAFRDFVKSNVNHRLQTALAVEGGTTLSDALSFPAPDAPTVEAEDPDVVTTDEEREAFQIVRAILAKHINPSRIVMRDTKSYCGVLLDDNNRKPVCRLRFNYAQKYLGIVEADRTESKYPIDQLTDLFSHEKELISALARVSAAQSSPSENALIAEATSTSADRMNSFPDGFPLNRLSSENAGITVSN